MSKFSNEFHQLSNEYVKCKKELFHSFRLLLIFAVVPFLFRFLAAGEDYIFNIYIGDFTSFIDILSVIGILVSSFLLALTTLKWVRLIKDLNELKN